MPTSNGNLRPTGSLNVGDWLVVPSLNRLSRGEVTVHLELKLMEVLVYLVENARELVSKRDLIDSVWKVEVISDGTLTRAIALLRKALGDDARNPQFIETIPKRGYRLIAPVGFSGAVESPAPTTVSKFRLVAPYGDLLLVEGENLIGRDRKANVRVDVPGVSRRHAKISVGREEATLEDLGSKNGTFLRGRRLDEPTRLSVGDEIRIGLKVARFKFMVED